MNSTKKSFSNVADQASKQAGTAFAEMLGLPVSVQLSLAEMVVPFGSTGFLDSGTRWGKAVHIHFFDEISGDALFLLPVGDDDRLVKTIFEQKPELKNTEDAANIVALDVGNLLLNACVGIIASRLGRRIKHEVPQVIESAQVNSLLQPSSIQRSKLLRMMSTLAVTDIKVRAYLVIILRAQTDDLGSLMK